MEMTSLSHCTRPWQIQGVTSQSVRLAQLLPQTSAPHNIFWQLPNPFLVEFYSKTNCLYSQQTTGVSIEPELVGIIPLTGKKKTNKNLFSMLVILGIIKLSHT